MAFLDYLRGTEARSLASDPIPVSYMDSGSYRSTVGVTVNEARTLGVPACFQAVNLISGTLAHLPLHLYCVNGTIKDKAVNDPLYRIVHDQPNSVHTKAQFFKWIGSRLLLDGRAIALITRNKAGRVAGFIPLDLSKVAPKQKVEAGQLVRTYVYDGKTVYQASDILDFVWLPKPDGLGHYSPLDLHKESIGAIIAAENYASALFEGGGVPPLKMTGQFTSQASQDKAHGLLSNALKSVKDRSRNVITLPGGFDLESIGIEPDKQQLLSTREFQIAEVSRIFNVPPALLYDLSHATYSNVETQNLSFAQHTMTPLIELIEQEFNSKLFGVKNATNSIEFNLDGLQRGAFKDRMEAMARGVAAGIRTPNESRALDNLPPLPGGDELYIQGAMIKLNDVGKGKAEHVVPPVENDQPDDPAA